MNPTAQLLFAYLRDILYDPEHAVLNLDELDDDFKTLGEGMQYLAHCVKEQRELATALSKGNLGTELPAPDNELAAPLKALHATLKHMTWQTQQVAKGDYEQRIDFMGEFANAFNTMVEQLRDRQEALEKEVERSRSAAEALQMNNSLLIAITNRIEQWIVVKSLSTREILYTNGSVRRARKNDPRLDEELTRWLDTYEVADTEEKNVSVKIKLPVNGETCYYLVNVYPLRWMKHNALAYVFSDISAERAEVKKLENYAYIDTLTNLYNRFYGMQVLREWVDTKRVFSVCFADLDNLKFVNDNYGHSAGDKYIIEAANELARFSKDAVVCRLGGDEFMLLAPGFCREETEKRMKVIRESMIDRNQAAKNPYLCSMSYGVVEVDTDNARSASDLLGLADERMYANKRVSKAVLRKTLQQQ